MRRSPRSRWVIETLTVAVLAAVPAQFATVSLLATVARSAIATGVVLTAGAQVAGVLGVVGVTGVVTGAAGVSGVAVRVRVYSSLFGEPVPALFTTPLVAAATSASRTCCGVAAGWPARYSAAAPVTSGV